MLLLYNAYGDVEHSLIQYSMFVIVGVERTFIMCLYAVYTVYT